MDGIRSFNDLRGAWSSSSGVYCCRRIAGGCKYCDFGGLFHHKPNNSLSLSFRSNPFRYIAKRPFICSIRKKDSDFELIPIVKEVAIVDDHIEDEIEEEDAFLHEDLEDAEELAGDDGSDDILEEDEYVEVEPVVGDGSGGGGVSLAGTSWDQTALRIAEEAAKSFDGELGIYAFKTMLNGIIQVRIEKLTNKSGSPTLMEVEAFSSVYKKRLDEAEVAGCIPGNLSMEVSSPGVERVVRVPQDLGRFKDRPLFVKYYNSKVDECDGIFRLVSFDLETRTCTWGLADVRSNREKAGKGRPLNKKQREWRLETTFDSVLVVRLYSEI